MIKWLKGGIENKKGQALYKGSLTKEARGAIAGISIVVAISVIMNIIDKKDWGYMLGLISFWIIYTVFIISLQQVFIIREKGIGKESIVFSGVTNLLEWDKVRGCRWENNKLTIMYTSSSKLASMDFKVKIDDKSIIDDIINKKLQ